MRCTLSAPAGSGTHLISTSWLWDSPYQHQLALVFTLSEPAGSGTHLISTSWLWDSPYQHQLALEVTLDLSVKNGAKRHASN
nr:hypothetical protein BgiMline_029781 [Biomphalaria glabrata]